MFYPEMTSQIQNHLEV